MNVSETMRVLAKVQAFDHRTIGDSETAVWHEAIGDLPFEDCMEAVTIHYRESDRWLAPAHIRRIAEDLDRKRRGRQRAKLLAGTTAPDGTPLAIGAAEREPSRRRTREVAELLEKLAAKLPAVTLHDKARRRARRDRGRPTADLTKPKLKKERAKSPKDYPPPSGPQVAKLATGYLYDGYAPAQVAEKLAVSRRWCEKAERKLPPRCEDCGNRRTSDHNCRGNTP